MRKYRVHIEFAQRIGITGQREFWQEVYAMGHEEAIETVSSLSSQFTKHDYIAADAEPIGEPFVHRMWGSER